MKIIGLDAMETLDSRGIPTLTAMIKTQDGLFCASVPSGASVGAHEAAELRDGGSRLSGKGVKKAVQNIRTVMSERLRDKDVPDIDALDALLLSCDSTQNKGVMGANAMLAVSEAACRALAAEKKQPLYALFGEKPLLPCPMMNILNGGAHADNNLDIQEFMVMPAGAKSFREAMDMGMEITMRLKALLKSEGLSTAVGDEGGFAPSLKNDEEALEFIVSAVVKAGLKPGEDVFLALDAAASEWAAPGGYTKPKSGLHYSREELISYFSALVRDYPILSIEDGMGEDDFEGFAALSAALPIQTVGDDLFVTNPERIAKGASLCAARAVLIKPNQIGSVSETLHAIRAAKSAGMATIASHRSGDTEDSFIADLCVGMACGQIKTGAPARAERTAKYNRLLMIEHELDGEAVFAGGPVIK